MLSDSVVICGLQVDSGVVAGNGDSRHRHGDFKPFFRAAFGLGAGGHVAGFRIGLLARRPSICTLTGTSQHGVPRPFARSILTNIFDLDVTTTLWPEVSSQRPIEKLLEHLKADPRQRSIVPALAKFVANESVLCPSWFVE